MALREYAWRGRTWQFDEDAVPDGAVPVKPARAKGEEKKAEPANKARKAEDK